MSKRRPTRARRIRLPVARQLGAHLRRARELHERRAECLAVEHGGHGEVEVERQKVLVADAVRDVGLPFRRLARRAVPVGSRRKYKQRNEAQKSA